MPKSKKSRAVVGSDDEEQADTSMSNQEIAPITSSAKGKEKAGSKAAPIDLEKSVEVISIDDDDTSPGPTTKDSELPSTLDCDYFFDKTYEQPHPQPQTPGQMQKVRDCKACRYGNISAI